MKVCALHRATDSELRSQDEVGSELGQSSFLPALAVPSLHQIKLFIHLIRLSNHSALHNPSSIFI